VLPGPLHRLTPLREDPSEGWLTRAGRLGATLTTWWAWAAYGLFVVIVYLSTEYVIETVLHTTGRSLPKIAAVAAGGALLIPVKRGIIALRAVAVVSRAKASAIALARSVDDLKTFPAEPDGRVISLVGWVSADGFLPRQVDGKDVVGLSLRVQDTLPYVFETMLNFDLVDEAGDAVLVATGGGRLIGRATTRLSRASEADRAVVTSLDIPASATPTDWNAFTLREGDPVMVIGTKTTVHDMTEAQRNRPTARPALASAPARPLLIIRLDAERLEA
jgi:hypothetical protein